MSRWPQAVLPAMLLVPVILGVLTAPGAPLRARQRGRSTAAAPAVVPPTREHAVLHRLIGEWSARMKVSAKAGDKPEKSRATETVRTCCAGLFVLTELRGKAKKSPRGGRGILGYDPARGRYNLAWAGARSSSLSTGEGDYDPESDTLTFDYEMPDGRGGTRPVREVLAWNGPDRRSRTIFTAGTDGSELPLITIHYRRK